MSTQKKQAFNPYLPSWEYIPDGEPYVFDGRVYVYGSHDLYDGEVFCLGDYVCWSAPVDALWDWRYEGVIYDKTKDPFNKDGRMCLYAPDVTVGPDGRYYLYYVLDKVNVVSVAVCDTPAGTYEFYGYVHYPDGTRLGDREGDEPQFDPGVLTEGEKTYLYTGFSHKDDATRHGSMLTILGKDMLTVEKAPQFVAPGGYYSKGTGFEGHAFFEASSIRKRGDLYYFVYSSEVMHELCYATSASPEGPFVYGGVIVSNCDIGIDSDKPAGQSMAYGANNHGSIVQIGDAWYIFYHRHTNGTWYSRQGCAERISFREDGSIPQVGMSSCGLNGGPLTDTEEVPSYIACHLFTDAHEMYVQETAPRVVQEGGDGDENPGYVTGIADGVHIGYRSFDCKGVTGLKLFTRGYLNGTFAVSTSWNGEVIGEIEVVSANIWTAFTGDFAIPDGVRNLYLTFRGRGKGSLKSFVFLHG